MIAKSITSVNRSRQKLVISLKIENIPYAISQYSFLFPFRKKFDNPEK